MTPLESAAYARRAWLLWLLLLGYGAVPLTVATQHLTRADAEELLAIARYRCHTTGRNHHETAVHPTSD